MALRFNDKAFVRDLVAALKRDVDTLTEYIWRQLISQAPAKVPRERITREEAKIVADSIVGYVEASGMWALITNYGSGTQMDTSNPGLLEYMKSQYWNPARTGTQIVGRPAGPYINLDNEVKVSSGKQAGKPLGFVKNYPAEHWFERVITLSEPFVLKWIAETVREFPIHRYIEDGR